jgi:signal transduction histidine kinase
MTREEVDRGIHPDDLPGLRRRVDAALADPRQKEISAEYRSAMPQQKHTWRQLTARVIRGADGRAQRVLGITVDISAQKTLEIQVRETQKMEALGRLAGGIAHDFGNILGVILGYTDLAARKIPESEPARKYVVEVGKAGRSGAALVQQILAFARRQELSPRRVDLRTTIGDMDGMLASLLGKRIEVRRDFASDTPAAMVDPNQFLRVVLNLCVNARDAMPEGGTITLRTRTASAGAPREDGSREDARDWVAFEVEDTGTGMLPEVRDRIFEPFFTTKAEGKGTGLGLATVHGIVKQSGGFLEVESEVGRGTLFRTLFPVAG